MRWDETQKGCLSSSNWSSRQNTRQESWAINISWLKSISSYLWKIWDSSYIWICVTWKSQEYFIHLSTILLSLEMRVAHLFPFECRDKKRGVTSFFQTVIVPRGIRRTILCHLAKMLIKRCQFKQEGWSPQIFYSSPLYLKPVVPMRV